jgi:ribonucleoside-triphosphate reductase
MKDGRGNLAPVTIIMPTLAMEAKEMLEGKEFTKEELVNKFMKVLDKKIHEAKDMLLERFERMCSQSPKAASFMWLNGTMFGYNEKEGPISALRHGTLALGELGLAETLNILIGKDQTTEEGMALAKEIEGLFKKRCAEFKKQYSLNFGVYYTPAENLCYTSFKKFKNKYGDIEGVTYYMKKDENGNETRKDKEYFTNSIHVPVYKEMSPFDKIDIESQLTSFSNAGCITYVELPSGTKNNIEGLETIVNYAMDKDIPYFAINVPIDECHDCGYTDEMGDTCPECGSHNVQHLRRVTGYLSTTYEHFNLGKQDEVKDRVKHINKL